MGVLIVFGIIALFCVLGAVFSDDKFYKYSYLALSCLLIGIITVFAAKYHDYNGTYCDGQIDALKGIYEYELIEVYYNNDTIPVDTIYVKIK
jgi:hypothetical protein